MKPLNGKESSILALLVQSKYLSKIDKDRILFELNGKALEIARVIVGDCNGKSKFIREAAQGLVMWAKNLN